MSTTGRAVLVICMFLLASSSHLQAARVVATKDHRVHHKKGPVSTSTSAAGSASSPCLHDAHQPALSRLANEPADIPSGGHGRALWSTPSDGVGH